MPGHRARQGGPRTARPLPLPLLQTFSQLPDLLSSAPRSASLMNYSAARAPISAPRPPRQAGAGEPPRPPRAPPSQPGAARPSLSPSQPRPVRPRAAVSLPPAPVPAPAPTLPAGAERTRSGGTSSSTVGRGGDRVRTAHPQPAGAGPRSPGGTPTAATSRCAFSARPQQRRPPPARPPARAAGTWGHTWAPPPGARRVRMCLR